MLCPLLISHLARSADLSSVLRLILLLQVGVRVQQNQHPLNEFDLSDRPYPYLQQAAWTLSRIQERCQIQVETRSLGGHAYSQYDT